MTIPVLFPDGHAEVLFLEFKTVDVAPSNGTASADPMDHLEVRFSSLNLLCKDNKRPRHSKKGGDRVNKYWNKQTKRATKRRHVTKAQRDIKLEDARQRVRFQREKRTRDGYETDCEVIYLSDDDEDENQEQENPDTNLEEGSNSRTLVRVTKLTKITDVLLGPAHAAIEDIDNLIKSFPYIFRDIPLASLGKNDITYEGKVLKKGTKKVRRVCDMLCSKINAPSLSIASKNLGHSGQGAQKTTIEKEINQLVNDHQFIELWGMQEAKIKNDFDPEDVDIWKNNTPMHFKKYRHGDLTGFTVSDTLADAQIAALDDEGRISVIRHSSLPFMIFNLYFKVNDYRHQIGSAKKLRDALVAAKQTGFPTIALGDFNSVVDYKRDTITKIKNPTEYQFKPGERDLMKFLNTIFKLLGLLDLFRHENPDVNQPTNFPYKAGDRKKRLDRIYVHRFLLDNYMYKLFKENRRISTHDVILLIHKDDKKYLAHEKVELEKQNIKIEKIREYEKKNIKIQYK